MKSRIILQLFCVLPMLALTLAAPSAHAITAAGPAPINGFSDPVGYTLNGNSGGYDGQDATAHGVPAISGGTLHLTTTQGVVDTQYNTFFGAENTAVYANQRQYIGQFYASFVYRYNGTNPMSFGPGNGFGFIMQNDPRGLLALGTSGIGNGQQGDNGTIAPSATVEFGLFTGFGQPRGTQLAFNGDPGIHGPYQTPGMINLISGDPIAVVLSYNGTTLSESLTDTLTQATYSTSYAVNLPAVLGTATPYIGFCGGTGAAVSDQTVSNFIFRSGPAAVPAPAPNLVVTATASMPQDAAGTRYITITVTNNGAVAADSTQITSVTLNGAAPPNGDVHNVLPTIPNLLPPGQSETDVVVYQIAPGTARAALSVGGIYTNPITSGTGHFGSTIRLVLP